MNFTKLVPNVFYIDISVGLGLFVDCLQFKITHNKLKAKQPFCVVQKDNLSIHLLENKEFAKKDRPAMRLQTGTIQDVF